MYLEKLKHIIIWNVLEYPVFLTPFLTGAIVIMSHLHFIMKEEYGCTSAQHTHTHKHISALEP